MTALSRLAFTETKLFLREKVAALAVFAFPVALVIGFGMIPGFGKAQKTLSGQIGTEYIASLGVAIVLAALGLNGVPMVIGQYRERGILRRLGVTPVRPLTLLTAKLGVWAASAVVSVAIVVGVARVAFSVPLPVELGWFVLSLALGIAALFALGMLAALAAPNARTAAGLGFVLFFPNMLLGGVYFPTENMTPALRRTGDFTPLGAGTARGTGQLDGNSPAAGVPDSTRGIRAGLLGRGGVPIPAGTRTWTEGGPTVAVPTPDSGLEPLERKYEALGRVLPYLLIVVPLLPYKFSQSPSAGAFLITVALAAGAALWTAVMTGNPRWRGWRWMTRLYLAGIVVLMAVLTLRSPWYAFYTWIGFLHAFQYLRGAWRWAFAWVASVIFAVAQSGGFHHPTVALVATWLVLAVVDIVMVGAFMMLGERVSGQNETRKAMIAELAQANERLEQAIAANKGLQAQLLTQAREAGIVEERQRMAREIHDTLAQGLTGIITQLEADWPLARRRQAAGSATPGGSPGIASRRHAAPCRHWHRRPCATPGCPTRSPGSRPAGRAPAGCQPRC